MHIFLKSLLWFSVVFASLNVTAQEVPIHITFNYSDSLTVEQRASAFAQWFNHIPTSSQEETREILMKWNIQPAVMLSVLGYENNAEGWELMRKNVYYFEEQGVKFKEAFYRLVNDASQKVAARKLELEKGTNSPGDFDAHCFLFYQPKENQFVVTYRNYSDSKGKIVSEDARGILRTQEEVLWRQNGRKKKCIMRPGETVVQQFEISANEAVKLVLKRGKKRYIAQLNNKRKETPLIRDFFVSDETVVENQRIYLTWDVLGANKVSVSNGIGQHQPKWQVATALEESTGYILSATNENGTVSDSLFVEVERITLKEAKLTFFTPEKGDPKELSSKVKVVLKSYEDGNLAFYEGLENLSIDGMKLPYVGPFLMEFQAPVYKRSFIRGEFSIALEGSAPDTWTFSPILILTYSDGSKKELYGYGNQQVNVGDTPLVFKF